MTAGTDSYAAAWIFAAIACRSAGCDAGGCGLHQPDRGQRAGAEHETGRLRDVLGKPNAPVPFMMQARIMQAAGAGRITEIIGSGPFVFRPDQWRAGDSMVLGRNAAYLPRQEPTDFLSGGDPIVLSHAVERADRGLSRYDTVRKAASAAARAWSMSAPVWAQDRNMLCVG
jgi:hypothetical protein